MSDRLCFLDARSLRDAIRRRVISPVEAVEATLDRIERVNPALNAFVSVTGEQALEQARAAERALTRTAPEELGALHGVPVTVKDLTPTAGVRTTYGSVHYADHVPDHDSLAWERMKAAGAILLGKTTTPDFGLLGVTECELTGVTNNPWDRSRTAGGSSGGAAASVVAGLGALAWGSDGGGSIRIPAACCGAVGLKASIGRIPGFGEQAPFETVTTCGPLTRTVGDAALLLDVTAGPDPRDPVALPAVGFSYEQQLAASAEEGLRGLRIAYSPDLGHGRVAATVRSAVEAALELLVELGATVEPVAVDLPDPLEYFELWWAPEMASFADEAVAEGWAETMPPAALELARVGRALGAVEHVVRLQPLRARLAAGFAAVFADHDLLVAPTMPLTAFPHPGAVGGNREIDGVPVARPAYDFHRLTEPASHAGLPSLTLPCGFDADGLPVGLQLVGGHHDDLTVLRAAAAYERATPWHERRPLL